ncbi:MAG: DUF2914 domain-containing protein [bacterium]
MITKTIFKPFEPQFNKIRRFLPAIAFFLGFTWDSFNMGRHVSFFSLLVLTSYYFGASIILIILVREVKPRWKTWLDFLVRFFFGGLFSALVVFYFKSSGSLYTFLVVVGLAVLLVANEFLAKKYGNRALDWALFAICSTMYLNFLIPHIAHSIEPIWFYLSCLVSLVLVFVIHHIATMRQRSDMPFSGIYIYYIKELRMFAPTFGVVFLLVVLYWFQLIPPVPLVLKESYICKDFSSENDIYRCRIEKQDFWQTVGINEEVIHFEEGQKIYNLSAIFAPTRIAVNLEQRWWFWDEGKHLWLSKGVINLPMVGGRKQGWRTFSYIQTAVRQGRWKVETALKNGAILADYYFTAEELLDPELPTQIVTIN